MGPAVGSPENVASNSGGAERGGGQKVLKAKRGMSTDFARPRELKRPKFLAVPWRGRGPWRYGGPEGARGTENVRGQDMGGPDRAHCPKFTQFLSKNLMFSPFLQGGTVGPQALALPTGPLLASPQRPPKPTSVSLSRSTSTAKPHPSSHLHDEKVMDFIEQAGL